MQESFFEALDMLKLLPAPILSSVADQLSAGLIQILGRHWSILSFAEPLDLGRVAAESF